MDENNMCELKNEFIKIALNSGKWKKWVSKEKHYTDEFKAQLCGHYVFSEDSIIEIKRKMQNKIVNFNLDEYITSSIEKLLFDQCSALRLIR